MDTLRIHAGLLAGLLALATAAQAQDGATTAATVSEVVITGSRTIKNGDQSPSPVTVVSTEDALKVQPGSLSEALNTLPVFAGSRGLASNPSSTGSAAGGNGSANQLNLRNLGSNRTLVLLDGVRVPPTTFNGVVDVDIIPQMLVQRVDTVTGGVSAVYGSDAVAGVVNYVIDKTFEGLKMQVDGGASQQGDAEHITAGVAVGSKVAGGRGHLEASYQYLDERGIPARSDRDWLDQWGVAGSGTAANPYRLYDNVRQAQFPFGGLITSGVLTGQTFASNGVLRPFVHGTATGTAALEIGGDGGYYDASLLAAQKAHQVFGRLDYDLTDNVSAYLQISGDQKETESYSDYVKLQNVTLSSQNAFLPAAYQAQLSAAGQPTFRLSELMQDAPRLDSLSKSHQWIYMGGLKGGVGDFDWNLNYAHGVSRLDTTLKTNVNNQRLAMALDAVVDPATNTVVCRTALTNPSLATGCAPLNVFGPTAASAAALAYVIQPTHYLANTKLDDVSANLSGPLFNTWAGPVTAAVSAEWRKLSIKSSSDARPTDVVDCTGIRYNCAAGGALWAFAFAPTGKVSQTVKEAAIEVDAPLLKDAPLVQSFSVNGAARFTSYDTSGDYWTWKLGFDWHVNDALRFRGTASRDIRAPTLYELFAPTNSVPVAPVDLLTGLSPSVPSTDLSNPDLRAEIAQTYTGGLVLRPLSGLSVALDAYRITISDAVVQVSGSTSAYQQACYASGGSSPWCALQERPRGYTDTSSANAVTRWYTKYMNLAEIETYGADLEINYTAELFERPAALRLLTSYQPHVHYRQPGVPATDQGNVAFGPLGMAAGPGVRIAAFARFKPADRLTVDVLERWRSAMKLGGDPTQVWVENRIDAYATTNVTLTWDADLSLGRTEVFLNVQNLFDATPPGGAYSGNGTRAGLRDGFALGDDVVGRAFTVGIRLRR